MIEEANVKKCWWVIEPLQRRYFRKEGLSLVGGFLAKHPDAVRKHLSMRLHNTIGKRVNNVSKDCTSRKS